MWWFKTKKDNKPDNIANNTSNNTPNNLAATANSLLIADAAAFRSGKCPFCNTKFYEQKEKDIYNPGKTTYTLYSNNTYTKSTSAGSSSAGRLYRVCYRCNYSYPVGETYWNPCRMEIGFSGIATASYDYECKLNEAQKKRVTAALQYIKYNG